MNNHKCAHLLLAIVLATITTTSVLLFYSHAALALTNIQYVALTGNCGGASPCFTTLQDAVDAANDGDNIKVAQGIYTGSGFQVVYVGKAITITGGYTLSDWINSYPDSRPTVIDAQNAANRRGVYINSSATLIGLTIQHGSVQGSGGGVYVQSGNVLLQNNKIIDNGAFTDPSCSQETCYAGGGLHLAAGGGVLVMLNNLVQGNVGGGLNAHGGGFSMQYGSTAYIAGNTFMNNSATWTGGGLYACGNLELTDNVFKYNSAEEGGAISVWCGEPIVETNTIQENSASGGGGGVYYYMYPLGDSTLNGNSILSNTAGGRGGGVYVDLGSIGATGNLIQGNSAGGEGGGVTLWRTFLYLTGNTIRNNHSNTYGGGVARLSAPASGSLSTNRNVIEANTAGQSGGGLAIFLNDLNGHNDIIANNVSTTGEGVYNVCSCGGGNWASYWTLVNNGKYAIVTSPGGSFGFANSIVASDTVGGLSGPSIYADHVLFYNSGTPCSVGAVCTNNLSGDPKFINPSAMDYHIGADSAAVDQATNEGLAVDIDGEPRPMRNGYDVGADELPPDPTASFIFSNSEWAGQPVVFSNTSPISGTASFLWNFGDGSTSGVVSPTHAYEPLGNYTVVLTETNNAGQSVVTETVPILYAAAFTSTSPNWLGQTTAFTNTSVTSGTTAYSWDLGDGSLSTDINPTHIYTTAGQYDVVLTSTNGAGYGVSTGSITVFGSPSVEFTATPLVGIRPLTVTFTDTLLTTPPGDPTLTRFWDFGDGTTSQVANPTHVYGAAGSYTVTLTSTNAAGSDTLTRTAYISVSPVPVHADFIGSPLAGIMPLGVVFTNTSSGDYSNNLWGFGDGITSTLNSPTHTYAINGIYTASLTVTGQGGQDTLVRTTYIGVYIPVHANFLAAPLVGIEPLGVTFTNTSTGDYLSSIWDFGDGFTSTLLSPTHNYAASGAFTVTLTASGHGGIDNLIRTNYVVVHAPAHAGFTAAPSHGIEPLTVTFTNTSTGDYATSLWDFGDSVTSTVASPTHTFTTNGVYTVTLSVAGLGGSSALTQTHYITAYAPVHADFGAAPTAGIAPLTVTFTNTSSGDYLASLWDFGDGFTSTLTNPTHLYTTSGAFTVTIAANGPGGLDNATRKNAVVVYAPTHAAFSATPTNGVKPLTVTFTNSSTGDFLTSLWDFGDGITSTLTNPAHMYLTAGTFTVTLRVNGLGGTDTKSRIAYVVVDASRIYLPMLLNEP